MSPSRQDPALSALESSLAELAPQQAAIDRDRLLFEAGRASALRRGMRSWIWPGTSALLAVVLLALAARIARGPAERIVYVVRESQPAADPLAGGSHQAELVDEGTGGQGFAARDDRPPEGNSPGFDALSYFALRQRVLTEGVDAIPELSTGGSRGEQPASGVTPRELARELLGG